MRPAVSALVILLASFGLASRMVDVVLDLVDDWHAGCWCWDDVSRASSYAALAIGFVAVSISLWGKIARPPGRAH